MSWIDRELESKEQARWSEPDQLHLMRAWDLERSGGGQDEKAEVVLERSERAEMVVAGRR